MFFDETSPRLEQPRAVALREGPNVGQESRAQEHVADKRGLAHLERVDGLLPADGLAREPVDEAVGQNEFLLGLLGGRDNVILFGRGLLELAATGWWWWWGTARTSETMDWSFKTLIAWPQQASVKRPMQSRNSYGPLPFSIFPLASAASKVRLQFAKPSLFGICQGVGQTAKRNHHVSRCCDRPRLLWEPHARPKSHTPPALVTAC